MRSIFDKRLPNGLADAPKPAPEVSVYLQTEFAPGIQSLVLTKVPAEVKAAMDAGESGQADFFGPETGKSVDPKDIPVAEHAGGNKPFEDVTVAHVDPAAQEFGHGAPNEKPVQVSYDTGGTAIVDGKAVATVHVPKFFEDQGAKL